MGKVNEYKGDGTTVRWDGDLCIHVGECGRAQCDLFKGGRDPWCDPTQVEDVVTIEVVGRCPTGALSMTRSDGMAEAAPPKNTVVVANNGPLYLRGALDIEGAGADQVGLKTRAALCRCGQSKNKPFCDNTHESVGFVDRGSVGKMGPVEGDDGGTLKVAPASNGPLLLSGNVEIVAGSGRVAWKGSKCALCRCGASKNKPFCDGGHRAAGFTAD